MSTADSQPRTQQPMHVFDVYARSEQGRILHFDVILPVNDPELALASARTWLQSIGHENASVQAENCAFCHTEAETPPQFEEEIRERGYAIYKMEGCPR